MSLESILAEATRLDKKSRRRALDYLTNVIRPLATDHYSTIDNDLMAINLSHVSSNTIMHLLTLAYYWRHLLPNWSAFHVKCYNELVTARGERGLVEALECLL